VLRIDGLTKRFGQTVAVDDLSLEIGEGEFFTLLGPSGCGKTTTLRCIGGLERPEGGSITLLDRCLVSASPRVFVPPERRNMGMVFQSYALWPHMTVFENVAYPLKLRRVGRDETRRRVADALRLVGLQGLEDRPAPRLSGGQQQRVALARALVFSPQILLLDEPLSNLDALLRDEMRRQLKDLQRRVGITTVYVTHDQVEALSLSDRIAILNQGRLEQVGTPAEIYSRPATPFAQSFLGKTFSLDGSVLAMDEAGTRVRVSDGRSDVTLLCAGSAGQNIVVGRQVSVAIRPERIRLWRAQPVDCDNTIRVRVRSVLFVGDRFEYEVDLGETTRVTYDGDGTPCDVGDEVFLYLSAGELTLWPR